MTAPFALTLLLCLGAPAATPRDDADAPAVAPALAPFEHLVGAWKGQAIPAANRLRGWPETHRWAWTFDRGAPSGMAIDIDGGKFIKSARLRFDPAAKRYVLEAKGLDGKPITYAGPIDDKNQTLTLDRDDAAPDGTNQRLVIRLNSNRIRYNWTVEEKPRGAPRFRPALDANLGKEGESFASGGSAADPPRCVLTGGAATMSVTYNGKSYPVCCTGCRDEFLADPRKYIKKAEARARANPADAAAPRKKAPRGDDSEFDGLIGTPNKDR
jgi:YHS domain-containing protein